MIEIPLAEIFVSMQPIMGLKVIPMDRASVEANVASENARSDSQKGACTMKMGSFFLILLVALIALGYLLSDTLHLREDVSRLQKENQRLAQELPQTEQAKIALQITTQELNVCQEKVEQSNQTIAHLADENTHLKEQNQLLASQQTMDTSRAETQPERKMIQATTFGLFAFIMLGVGSIVAVGLKSFPKDTRHSAKTGQFVYLTNAEIKDLIRRRRESNESNK